MSVKSDIVDADAVASRNGGTGQRPWRPILVTLGLIGLLMLAWAGFLVA
jgi:hypothetical protein